MHPDPAADDTPPTPPAAIDAAALKDAHGRTGRMFKNAGLPFEEDEFDGDGEDAAVSDEDSAGS